jgi:hypothetical protein
MDELPRRTFIKTACAGLLASAAGPALTPAPGATTGDLPAHDLNPSPLSAKFRALKAEFDRLLQAGSVTKALHLAMGLRSAAFGEDNEESARMYLFRNFFAPLDRDYKIQYQAYDFEVVDYDMCEFHPARSFLRGPLPSCQDLIAGNYVSVLGAAQLFGRFHKTIFPDLMAEEGVSTPVLNFSLGGAGPDYFSDDLFVASVNHGRGCVLQVLSGRSAGTRLYPGMRMTRRAGSASDLEDRLDIYARLWSENPGLAGKEIRSCQASYMERMTNLIASIRVPIVLVWISTRHPEDWSVEGVESGGVEEFGAFPQLVDQGMWNGLKSQVADSAVILDDPALKTFANEFTGKPCPIFKWTADGTVMWSDSYYPSQDLHRKVAGVLTEWLNGLS